MGESKFYLSGSLPKPFTNEENEKYFLMAKDGDLNALDIIKEHNLRLVISIISNKFYNVEEIDASELFSIGAFGLNKAVDTFDISKDVKFSTYAGRVIENEILMAIRKNKNSRNNVSLESTIYDGKDGEELALKHTIASDTDLEEQHISKELMLGVRKSLEVLTERERDVIELYYGFRGDLLTHYQIGRALGISQSYVSRIKSRSLNKLRKYLIHEGLIEEKNVTFELENISELPSEEKVMFYAQSIIEDNLSIDELSKKVGISTRSIKTLISKKLPLLDNDLYIKMQGVLEMRKTDNQNNTETNFQENKAEDNNTQTRVRNSQTLLELFPKHTEEEIRKALESIDERDKEVFLLRYPLNGETPKTINLIAKKYNIKMGSMGYRLNNIKNQIMKALEGQIVTTGKTIFEYFQSYSEEQVLKAISSLNEESRKIIELKYGLNGNDATSNGDIAKLYNSNSQTISGRIFAIRKGIQSRLDKLNQTDCNYEIQPGKTIFEYFQSYSEEQVLKAISSLSEESRKIIELKYGLNGNSVTSNTDIAKLYNSNSQTISSRIFAIRKGIQSRLDKLNQTEVSYEETINLANLKVEEIKKSILGNVYDQDDSSYNINGIKVTTEKREAMCLITGKNKKYDTLDTVHRINKKCFVYIIKVVNYDGKTISKDIFVQDIKTGKFYQFINRYTNGEYDISSIKYDELVCYGIQGVAIKKIEKEEEKPKTNIVEQPEQTQKELPKYTQKQIEQADSCLAMGIKLFNQGQHAKARVEFLKALASGKTSTLQTANYYLGTIELASKRLLIAQKYLMTSLEYDENNFYTLLQLGKTLSKQGKFDDAKTYFDRCCKLKSNITDPIIEQARNLIRQKKYTEALIWYDKGLLIKPNDYFVYLDKGELLYNLKYYKEAKKALMMCSKIKPDKKIHNRILGKIAYLEGDIEQAKKLFNELISSVSKTDYLIEAVNIGFFFHKLGDKELTYEYYSKIPKFKKRLDLTEKAIETHIQEHMKNSENETMHSVFNFPVSMKLLNELIKDMDKTSIKERYDVYQIHCENAGYTVIDDELTEKEDYITILTLPFTKKIMLAYPDFKLPNVEVVKSVSLEDLLNFDKSYDSKSQNEQPTEVVQEEDITVITNKNQTVVNSDFEQCREQVKMFINMMNNPTEQVILLLRLGYVREKYYSENEIATFLNISEEEVKNTINKSLSNLACISSRTLNWLESSKTITLNTL